MSRDNRQKRGDDPKRVRARYNRDGSITLSRGGAKIFRTTAAGSPLSAVSPPVAQVYAFLEGYSGDGRRRILLAFDK